MHIPYWFCFFDCTLTDTATNSLSNIRLDGANRGTTKLPNPLLVEMSKNWRIFSNLPLNTFLLIIYDGIAETEYSLLKSTFNRNFYSPRIISYSQKTLFFKIILNLVNHIYIHIYLYTYNIYIHIYKSGDRKLPCNRLLGYVTWWRGGLVVACFVFAYVFLFSLFLQFSKHPLCFLFFVTFLSALQDKIT